MRPYTLSKKLLALVTLQFSLATNSRFSKIEKMVLVGLTRVELVTSSLSGTRSNQLSYKPKSGGGSRIRTGDMLLAKQPLYQLSYTPDRDMVGLTRIELVTSSLSGTRSNQLSYKPLERFRKGDGTLVDVCVMFQLSHIGSRATLVPLSLTRSLLENSFGFSLERR